MTRQAYVLLLIFICSLFAARASARAPDTFEEDYHPPIIIESPVWFAFEAKIGPYQAGDGSAFEDTFQSDRGWMFNLELDVTVWRIPYIGHLDVGAGWGWAKYDRRARLAMMEGLSGETTEFKIYPISALGVLRIDALARYTVLPLSFAGKLGYEWVRWKATTGGEKDGDGVNDGLRWALQAALQLDFFDRGAARQVDDDFGVNHLLFLFEFYQSHTNGTGDRTFSFGLGAQF